MSHQIRCQCDGNPRCELCRGAKSYDYQPGPRGWMPFVCPTCRGTGRAASADGDPIDCFTCNRLGRIDPANPPDDPGVRGFFGKARRIFFGG